MKARSRRCMARWMDSGVSALTMRANFSREDFIPITPSRRRRWRPRRSPGLVLPNSRSRHPHPARLALGTWHIPGRGERSLGCRSSRSRATVAAARRCGGRGPAPLAPRRAHESGRRFHPSRPGAHLADSIHGTTPESTPTAPASGGSWLVLVPQHVQDRYPRDLRTDLRRIPSPPDDPRGPVALLTRPDQRRGPQAVEEHVPLLTVQPHPGALGKARDEGSDLIFAGSETHVSLLESGPLPPRPAGEQRPPLADPPARHRAVWLAQLDADKSPVELDRDHPDRPATREGIEDGCGNGLTPASAGGAPAEG